MWVRKLLLLGLAALLASCSLQTAPPALPTPPEPTAAALASVPLPVDMNPLTGLPLPAEAQRRRPLIVKISNAPPLVRPQAGISAADMVFEHYVEGGLTRFSAVFWSQLPERVGSIRSARLIDLELVPMFQAIFAYSGTSEGVGARLRSMPFYERTYLGVAYPAPYFWRDETLLAPHNLFLNATALSALAAEEGYGQAPVLTGLAFAAAAPGGSQGSATTVEVRYRATRAGWIYDAVSGRYLRFSDGQPHLDANTRQQVSADNVVIIYAEHRETDIVESVWQDEISYSLEMTLTGEGEALMIRDGQAYAARWLRPAADDLLRLVTAEGVALPLRPGSTWVQVFPPPSAWAAGEAVRAE